MRWRPVLAAPAVAVLVLSCSAPELQEPQPQSDVEQDVTAQPPDPTRDELVGALTVVSDTVRQARTELEAAAAADSTAAVRSSSDAALDLLLDEPAASSDGAGALFPAVSTERSASGEQDDLLAGLLSLAREAGGGLGRDVIETLRDPVAGDLGTWERDAEGVVADLRSTIAGVTGLDGGIEALSGFQGEGTRALGWTMLAASTPDTELARAAAERASGHLGVVVVALDLLEQEAAEEPTDGPTPDGSDDGSSDDGGEDGADEPEVPDDLGPEELPDPDSEPVGGQA